MSQVEEGSIGVLMCMSVAKYYHCCVATITVVPLLYCADGFGIYKCGLELSFVVFRIARPHNRHANTESPFVAVTKRRLEVRLLLLLYSGCCVKS